MPTSTIRTGDKGERVCGIKEGGGVRVGVDLEKWRSRAEKEPAEELLHKPEMPPLAWKILPAKVQIGGGGGGAGLEEGIHFRSLLRKPHRIPKAHRTREHPHRTGDFQAQ